MMACSYLSAGGMKSDSSSAACWSPPAMAGAAPSTRLPLPPPLMTLPSGPMALPSGPMALPSGPMALPSGPMVLPSRPMALPSGPMALPSRPMPLPSAHGMQTGLANLPNPIGLPIAPMAAPRAAMPQKTGQSEIPIRSMGLPCAMEPMGLSGMQTLPSGTGLPSNSQIGLPPPFIRPLPMELGSLPLSGSSSEPALDLSTSALPSSLKRRLPSSEDKE